MRTALDAPAGELDADEQNFVDQIREHGWFATHVLAEGAYPGFTYSTGFWLTLQQPEIILFSLSSNTAHDILWDVFRDLRDGTRLPVGQPTPGILGNADACLFRVAEKHYGEYLGENCWFYGGSGFLCLQLVWPDRVGRFPWESGFDESFSEAQPDLSESGWAVEIVMRSVTNGGDRP